jgi:hypothetical protein
VKLRGTVWLQDVGGVPLVNDQFARMRGQDRQLQGFDIRINPPIPHLKLEYMAHVEDFGDTDWFPEGVAVGTIVKSRRLEGFAIRLTGTVNLGIPWIWHTLGDSARLLASNHRLA